MNEVDAYVNEVMRNIHASPRDRARIEADLRAHLAEATAAGEPATAAISRMGSPTQVAEAFMAGVALCYAGLWRRLAAFAVDIALCALVAAVLGILGALAANLVPAWNRLVPPSTDGLSYAVGAVLVAITASLWLGVLGVFLLYFPVTEGRFGQTLGKRLLGLRVLRENGLPIGYKEAFLRRIPFYFRFTVPDALFIFFRAKRQRAFDIVARTVVVREEQ